MPTGTIIRVVAAAGPTHPWLFDWQTLVAGSFALVPALLIYRQLSAQHLQNRLLREQIDAERQRIEAAREATLRSWRVVLPTVLSEVLDYSEQLARHLESLVPGTWVMYPPQSDADRLIRLTQKVAHKIDLAEFPPHLVEPLRRIVEHSLDEAIHQRVASIFREVQILDVIRRDLARGAEVQGINLTAWILQAMALWARAASLFDFARGKSQTVETMPLWERVMNGLDLASIRWDAVIDRAKAERLQGMPPGRGDELGLPDAEPEKA